MDKETTLQSVSVEALQELIQYIKMAVDAGVTQVPLLAQDILWRGAIINSITAVFAVGLAIAGWYWSKYALKTYHAYNKDRPSHYSPDPEVIMPMVGSIVCVVVCSGLAAISLSNLLIVICAPRIYILEQVMAMCK